MIQERPRSRITKDNEHRVVAEPFTWEWQVGPAQVARVEVPAGLRYRLSGGAVGRALIRLLGPSFAFENVCAVHDYVYRRGGRCTDPPLTRREADLVLFSDPADPAWMQWPVYLLLRLGGWWAWSKHT